MISYRYLPRALSAAIVLVPLVVAAQTAERDPLNAQAATASAPYQSAFTDYQSYQDPQMVPWRAANDEVGRPGGMTGHDMSGMKGMKGMKGMSGMKDMGDQEKRGNMPAHDMSSMKGAGNAETMKAMPGRDMKDMKGAAASPSATKAAPSAGKSAERAPQAMPDHNGMQKQ